MELFLSNFILSTMLVLLLLHFKFSLTSAVVGVNYGMVGNNLPSPREVVELYKKQNIPLMRLFEPNQEVLQALRGSGIKISLGTRNEDVPALANNNNSALNWVKTNVAPYAKDVKFGWITLGNEMVPSPNAQHIPKAMENIRVSLQAIGLTNIKVSTVVHGATLGKSYPPSAGDFSDTTRTLMKEIISWLGTTNNPLLVNVYPYFAFSSDPANIPLQYALFNAGQPVVDGKHVYYSLFEAMVDAYYAATEKNGGGDLTLVVSETGWPTAGDEPYTNKENARNYNQKLIDKMKVKGTPRKPNAILDIFVFAMFNENQKSGAATEQNWGIYYPNKQPLYPLKF